MICFKIKNLKLKIAIGFILIILLFAKPEKLQAQTISLSIWPPLLEVQMMPGKTVSQNYQLVNNSDFDLQMTPLLATFEPRGENGEIKLLAYDPSPYFFSFTTNEKFNQEFTLKSKETRQLALKITLPKNNPEKDYYFTLLFSSANQPLEQKNQTASITQIGTNILLTSSTVEKPPLLGRIYQFSAPKIIDSFSSTEFSLILENFGQTFFKPFGQIKITGPLKQSSDLKLLEQNILAHSKRQMVLESFKPKLALGPFKAKLEFSLNEEGAQPVLSQEIVFWYLPYKLLLFITIIGFLFFFLRKLQKTRLIMHNMPLDKYKKTEV